MPHRAGSMVRLKEGGGSVGFREAPMTESGGKTGRYSEIEKLTVTRTV